MFSINFIFNSPVEQFDNFTIINFVNYLTSGYFSNYLARLVVNLFGGYFIHYLLIIIFLFSIFNFFKLIFSKFNQKNSLNFNIINIFTIIFSIIFLLGIYFIGFFEYIMFFIKNPYSTEDLLIFLDIEKNYLDFYQMFAGKIDTHKLDELFSNYNNMDYSEFQQKYIETSHIIFKNNFIIHGADSIKQMGIDYYVYKFTNIFYCTERESEIFIQWIVDNNLNFYEHNDICFHKFITILFPELQFSDLY